jgi:hypothetical protein
MNSDERWCFEQLQTWLARFDDLMALYEQDRAFVPAARIAQARDLYTKLKADLEIEGRRLSNSRLAHPAAEQRWYSNAVYEARGHLRASTNSKPEAWHSDLYNARSDFFMDLEAMRRHFDVSD